MATIIDTCRTAMILPKSDASAPTPRRFKKGLNTALKDSVQKRKDGLVARLNRKEKISAVDWLRINEAWLDNDTSHVEEDWSAGSRLHQIVSVVSHIWTLRKWDSRN
ncbi:hypothetical protein B0H13DRAFT_1884448 [Mycena leptocephala]|nr:hypothetical protein B0H13DRAFT_1884448 [Mycena leptocephala]